MDVYLFHFQNKNNLSYYLKFPNQEVKSSLKLILADFILQAQQEAGKACSNSILASLRQESWVTFFNIIRSDCLAKSGYRFLDKTEKSFQGTLYSFLNGAFHTTHGTWAIAERDSGIGRTDIRLFAELAYAEEFVGDTERWNRSVLAVREDLSTGSTSKLPAEVELCRKSIVMEDQYNDQTTVYIFELKCDKPACDGLEQIHNKDYSIQYGTCRKKVLIGLTCDAAKRNITEAVIEVHQKDDQNEFNTMPRKNFRVSAMGYFQQIG